MDERFIQYGRLTGGGIKLASELARKQCDQRECKICILRDKDTNGPGGFGCPATDITNEDVKDIMTVYSDGLQNRKSM